MWLYNHVVEAQRLCFLLPEVAGDFITIGGSCGSSFVAKVAVEGHRWVQDVKIRFSKINYVIMTT